MARYIDGSGSVIYSGRRSAEPVRAGSCGGRRTAEPVRAESRTERQAGPAATRSFLSKAARALKGPDRAQIHARNVLSSLRCELVTAQAREAYKLRLYGASETFDELESDIGLCETLAKEAEMSFDADEFFLRFGDELLYLDAKYGLRF